MTTRSIAKFMSILALENKGYAVTDENAYLYAEREGTTPLLIALKGRQLSNRSEEESTPVSVNCSVIDELRADAVRYEAIPCVAYCVMKYKLEDAEVCIIPIHAIEENPQRGSVYNITDLGYFYNYDKNTSPESLPPKAILRSIFQIRNAIG